MNGEEPYGHTISDMMSNMALDRVACRIRRNIIAIGTMRGIVWACMASDMVYRYYQR
jgi:hypothetical protein